MTKATTTAEPRQRESGNEDCAEALTAEANGGDMVALLDRHITKAAESIAKNPQLDESELDELREQLGANYADEASKLDEPRLRRKAKQMTAELFVRAAELIAQAADMDESELHGRLKEMIVELIKAECHESYEQIAAEWIALAAKSDDPELCEAIEKMVAETITEFSLSDDPELHEFAEQLAAKLISGATQPDDPELHESSEKIVQTYVKDLGLDAT